MSTTVSITHGKEKKRLEIVISFQDENRFLSNFWPCDITLPAEKIGEQDFPALDFKSVENAYQAWKSQSLDQRIKIQAMTPGEAKIFSREGQFEIRYDITDTLRVQIMGVLQQQKYSDKNPDLKKQLIDIKQVLLVEGNDWDDDFFGFCLKSGQGQNHLGRLIMKRRDQLLNNV